MSGKHISSQFDTELNAISTRVMEMGGLVEVQLRDAITALSDMDSEVAQAVIEREVDVNNFELELDRDISSIIGRRQPTARDLRLLMAMSRTTNNLERAGDEVAKMARMVKSIIASGDARSLPISELHTASELASQLLRKSLDAIARLDIHMALTIIKEDDLIDREYNGFLRKLMTYIMEDARTISPSLNLLFLAKAIERVGDHAKNIAESTIYVVKGEDVRHASVESVESLVK
ncbi:MAG: phosphate signaling complex protein PhoU [Burkholderiaceae bacterium]|jgi:phosphate transport system protein|tara:strand:- start:6215 stop:6916 length:702 start_codon:yes stop_codon:yes gene_type:complete